MLTILDLSKTYPDDVQALRDVSPDIPKLGPNGACTLARVTVDGTPSEAGVDPSLK